jgi:hypothetical protein
MLEFTADKATENSELEISFDEAGAKQLIQLIEDCFKTGHEHLLPLDDDSRWALTITGPNSYQCVTLYLEKSTERQDQE